MAKTDSVNKRLRLLLAGIRNLESKAQARPQQLDDAGRNALIERLASAIAPLMDDAFAEAGLDPNNDFHREQLLMMYVVADRGRRRYPGAPMKWTPKALERLLKAVLQLRTQDPTLSETRACLSQREWLFLARCRFE
jgi:hypothetical protein